MGRFLTFFINIGALEIKKVLSFPQDVACGVLVYRQWLHRLNINADDAVTKKRLKTSQNLT